MSMPTVKGTTTTRMHIAPEAITAMDTATMTEWLTRWTGCVRSQANPSPAPTAQ